jgi:hypothetical protein
VDKDAHTLKAVPLTGMTRSLIKLLLAHIIIHPYICPGFAIMKKVTLRFPSLQQLADCLFQLGITRPVIDYDKYLLTADLTDKQLSYAEECDAQVVDIIVAE